MRIHDIKKSGLYLITKLHLLDSRTQYSLCTIVGYLIPELVQKHYNECTKEYIAFDFSVILTTIRHDKVPCLVEPRRMSYFCLIKEVKPLSDYQFAKLYASLKRKGIRTSVNPTFCSPEDIEEYKETYTEHYRIPSYA